MISMELTLHLLSPVFIGTNTYVEILGDGNATFAGQVTTGSAGTLGRINFLDALGAAAGYAGNTAGRDIGFVNETDDGGVLLGDKDTSVYAQGGQLRLSPDGVTNNIVLACADGSADVCCWQH